MSVACRVARFGIEDTTKLVVKENSGFRLAPVISKSITKR